MSPGCVISWTAVGPSRPGLTIVARLDANACKNKPQSVGELVNSHDHTALGEIWALAGGGGANTKIAAATALARNSFIGTPAGAAGSEDAVPDLPSSPQPTNQGAEKRSKCEGVEGATTAAANDIRHRDWSGRGRTARDDEVNGRTARHPRAGRRALADDAAGGDRTARLHRDCTDGEARAGDGARGRRLRLAHHIRHRDLSGTARDDEADGRTARHPRAGSRALADDAAGGHRTARLLRDRTHGEARAGDGARGRRLRLAHDIRHRDLSGRGRTARDDEADGRTARHPRAGGRALPDHAAGSHRTARLLRDRTHGEARAGDDRRGGV